MDLNKPNIGISRPCISNKTLDSDNIDFVVWAAVFETYCIHAAINQDRRAELLRETGRIKYLIRSLGPPLKDRTDEMLVGVDLDGACGHGRAKEGNKNGTLDKPHAVGWGRVRWVVVAHGGDRVQ